VHRLLSSQLGATPPTQLPAAQVSLVVQALPSSQGATLGTLLHPVAALHESSVQPFKSSQFGGAPPTHAPAEQVSLVVQALPSSQGAALGLAMQPRAWSQESLVHRLPSSQLGAAPPMHMPALQTSLVVQALPSSQAKRLAVLVQPLIGSHESVVQTLPSSQLGGGPPTQVPAAQVSAEVQGFPSSQAVPLGTLKQPVAGLHASSVQRLPSLQSGGSPPVQTPEEHMSPMVQASPSSQETATLA